MRCSPGFVKTDFGGDGVKEKAEITPQVSVSKALATLNSKTVADSGSFWAWNGDRMPW